ncbi:MAG: DEAD/DEAH box helicase [Prevotella sp.]|nr:DEAD/DEAH box helicase [Prevotella sp.]
MLRDYQIEICEKVNEAFEAHRSVMMQMPTGTGKTVVLASLVKQYLNRDADCSVLIVAHRIELIGQTGTFLNHFGIDYGMIAGGKRPAVLKRVMVASVQTLSKNLDIGISPSLVVIDEAHHALAKTYQMLWTAWPEAKFLGLTATPYRMSGDGFTDLFEVLVDSWSVKQFIADGWLSPYDYYSIRPDSEQQQEIDSLKKRGADGDFQMKELREKLDVRPSIERLFEAFERFAFDKKGIIYAIDIAHAEHIAEFYRLQGVNAVAISSKTPAKERAEVIRTFKGGNRIQILVSVDLFSEGFDFPDVEFIQMARPTLSLAKYLQMVGRGLRPCKGKQCCTIIDNVGLYRTFGLPSVDRDWGELFLGNEGLGIRNEELGIRNEQFLWLGCGDLREENDGDIVKIISYEGMQEQFTKLSRRGFERRKKGKAWVWTDMVNGVEFDRHPKVINYRGMELSTADGDTFFPRISSKWIDAKHGISRKALETQVGGGRRSQGIGWMKLYISFAMPDKVLQLQAVKPNQMRIYKDEQGKVYLQQDPDHAPVSEEEAGGRKAFMALCDKQQKAWEEMKKSIRKSSLKYDTRKRWWQLPEGSIREQYDEKRNPNLYHIIYKENGDELLSHGEKNKEFWVDSTSGFTYRHRPVLCKRGFVELLYDGDVVYILNIHEERFTPYRNWEIRADNRICTIGNKLYFNEEKDARSYRIKKRSDDFRMFVVEERYPNYNPNTIEFDEFIIINEAGKKLEIKAL